MSALFYFKQIRKYSIYWSNPWKFHNLISNNQKQKIDAVYFKSSMNELRIHDYECKEHNFFLFPFYLTDKNFYTKGK